MKNSETFNIKRTDELKIKNLNILSLFLIPIILVIFINPSLRAEECTSLWGRIVDGNNNPLQNAKIIISSKKLDLRKTLHSDSSGSFQVSGVPAGKFSIHFEAKGCKPHIQERIFFDPSQLLYIEAVLCSLEEKESSRSSIIRLDYSNCFYQTILDRFQIQAFPSAHNIWSLVENQDLSATTNRIDVGGLWGHIPALFSSRGGCSWTQNVYLLNGLDVSDPYWTGKPLFYPDFHSLRLSQLINAGHPVSALSPGAHFNLLTRDGTDGYHGGISAFYINKRFQSSNISPALEAEGLYDSHSFNYLAQGNFHYSGPIIPKKLSFFTSWSSSHISRDLSEFEKADKSSVYSGLLSLKYRFSKSALRLLWTGQIVRYPSYGAERHIPWSSTSDRRDLYNVLQVIWNSRIRDSHFFKAGFCFSHADIRSEFQDEASLPHGWEVFENIPSGATPSAHRDQRNSFTFLFKGESLASRLLGARHRFQYGLQLQHCSSSSKKEIFDNIHLRYFEEKPLEIVEYNTPVYHRESALHLNLFIQDSLTLSNFLSFYFGVHLAFSRGQLPSQAPSPLIDEGFGEFSWGKGKIQWLNLSPRIGIILPLSKSKKLALKISAARYYLTLPLYLLTFGNSNSLGGLVYSWDDMNQDKQYQEGEAKALIRREGPYFSKIDPDLKRPYTDELAVSLDYAFGSSWYFSFGGFYRESRNLLETINIGVPFSEYDALDIFDIGDDRIPDTHDDLIFTVYNQKKETLGKDFFLLTNPDAQARVSRYYGLDLILIKKYNEKFTFFLTLTATQADGTTSPGDTEWENDDYVVGSLYDNPNTLINTEGRMRFDRAYTGRIGFNFLALFGIRVGCIVKYYDGQPFARKIIVKGMNQGPFFIQAHPRGISRYEYNMTTDIRLEKALNLGKAKIKIIFDGFNIFNRNLATKENDRTGPEFPLRFATEIQSPRVFRLGLAYEF